MGHFSFAGEHSTDYSVYLLRSPISIFPGTRDKVIVMPGRHGVFRMLPDFGPRILRLECWLKASSYADIYQKLDAVRSWLNPIRGPQKLVFDHIPDRYYSAIWAGSDMEAQVTANQGLFTLQMTCDDPFAYDLVPDEILIQESPYTHHQRGTAPADPLFLLQGLSAGGNQSLAIKVNDEQVIYRGPLEEEEQLEIDSLQKTVHIVRDDGRERALHHLERPVFPQLAPGVNILQVIADGGAAWTRLDINCRNRWL